MKINFTYRELEAMFSAVSREVIHEQYKPMHGKELDKERMDKYAAIETKLYRAMLNCLDDENEPID